MWKAEKARYALAVKRAELNTAALLTLAFFCFLPLMGELDCNGTHAWTSIDLALLGVPVWCMAFLYRGWSFANHRRDMWVYGLLLASARLFISGSDGWRRVGLVAGACLPASAGGVFFCVLPAPGQVPELVNPPCAEVSLPIALFFCRLAHF